MKKTLTLCLILLFFINVHAQIITIRDKVTNLPIEMVTIISESPQAFAITDVKGKADISAFKNSEAINIRLLGYKPQVLSYDDLEKNDFKVKLEESQVSLNEIVISANRWEQERRDIPNKITAIRPTQIALQNPQTAADLLSLSGEVYIQKSQLGGGSPVIRGFAANRVLLVVDGVRMNNAIFRSGNLQNVISIDPFAIEEAEVIFGPGSVIYGSDAIGGVMDFHTLTPRFTTTEKPLLSGTGAVRYGTANNEKTGHFDINLGFKKWSFLTSASFSDFDDLKMGSNGPDDYLRPEYATRINGKDTIIANPDPEVQVPSGYSQWNVMQKIRFKPSANWDFNYAFHYSATSDYPRYDRLIEYRKGTLRDAEWYYGPQEWMMNTLNITNSNAGTFYDNGQLTVAYQNFGESRHNRSFGSNNLFHRTEGVDVISSNLDFDKGFGEKHHIFYGAEALFNTITSTGTVEHIEKGTSKPTNTRYPDGSTWNSYAAYTTYRFKPGNRITLQTGLRYNYVTAKAEFDTTFFPFPFTEANLSTGALTGSAGVAYKPHETMQVNFNFSTGFRAPNIDDLGKVFDSEPGMVVVPNPDLKSEYAYNVELGIIKSFGGWIKLDATGFYIQLQDALVRRPYTLNGQDSILYEGAWSDVEAIQNAANAYVYGVQAGVEIDLPAGFSLSSRYSIQKGKEELDNGETAPLRHAAPAFGVTHLFYKRSKFIADLYAVYNGEISYEDLAPSEKDKPHLYAANENGNPYSPSWYTINVKASYHITDYLQLTAGIENITDQRYRPYSSGIAGPGRNFIASLRAKF